MVRHALVALALATVPAGFAASPASAVVPCEHGDVSCYQTCYVPHVDKSGIYWTYC